MHNLTEAYWNNKLMKGEGTTARYINKLKQGNEEEKTLAEILL